MALKGLNQFLLFDMSKFLEGKKLVLVGIEKWRDYNTKKELGEKAILAIVEDKTPYQTKSDGSQISNAFEKIQVKLTTGVKIPVGTEVSIINPTATVWGKYQENLSVKAENIVPVSANAGGKP